jgi:tripartite-type tricarboxylate transporter receptor subunit TctC
MKEDRMKPLSTALLVSLAVLAWQPAAAQDYPSRTIRLVSPNPPGGANDTIGRIYANEMSKTLGQQIVIENRGGGGGTIGAQSVAEAAPDGYTLLLGSVSTHGFSPLITPGLRYDPVKDFSPVSMMATVPNVLVVSAALPVKSVQELVAYAKANPGKLNYASGGKGSTSHFAVAMFVSVAGIAGETVHIPYKGGAPALTATAGNETQFYVGPVPGMGPLIEAGQIKPLAVSGEKRLKSLPEAPTFIEAGLPRYSAFGWFGMIAPAKTPEPTLQKLSDATAKAAASPAVMEALAQQGVEAASSTPQGFAAFIAEQVSSYRKLVEDKAVTLD